MVIEAVAGSTLGWLLGMRHVLEPDHLAAVSTLVTGQQSAKAAQLGALWGLGHTLTLLLAAVVLIALSADMPASASRSIDLAVAVVMITLGVRATYQGVIGQRTIAVQRDVRAGAACATWSLAQFPFAVGAIHGLAGSGAVTALVVAAFPSTAARAAYLLAFGIGSILGMAALSGLLVLPLARLRNRRAVLGRVLAGVGSLSLILGLARGYAVLGHWFPS